MNPNNRYKPGTWQLHHYDNLPQVSKIEFLEHLAGVKTANYSAEEITDKLETPKFIARQSKINEPLEVLEICE